MKFRTHCLALTFAKSLLVLALLPRLVVLAEPIPSPLPSETFLIEHVRVFDGQVFQDDATVEVRGGKILYVGNGNEIPANSVPKIDGRELTLLPGLIDAHTHCFGEVSLKQALAFGVTTEFDMFSAIAVSMRIKAAQQKGEGKDWADLFTAGTLATAPGGHGTEYGLRIPTLTEPAAAQAFVDARIAEGSDYIKIVYDDGRAYGRSIPTVSKDVLRALILGAHARSKLAIIHVASRQEAREAIDARADALAHLFLDAPGDAAFVNKVKDRRAFVIPTLSILRSISGSSGGAALSADARLKPFLGPVDGASLQRHFTKATGDYQVAEQTVAALLAAGVPILAGTDAPNPGTAHGISLHGELELLVAAGLSIEQALAAATSVPAEQFKIKDRGRIAPGYRADLLLVRGDLSKDIQTTRDIVGIWKEGVPFDREAYRKEIATAQAGAKPPANLGDGLIADFDTGQLAANFGAGWLNSTDTIAGGKSGVELNVVPQGAEGSSHALAITGKIDPALSYAWAGALFAPGAQPFVQAVDFSEMRAIDFWTKGDGKTYRVMIFTQSQGPRPLIATFTSSAEWTHVTLPFANFEGNDGKGITAILFSGGPQPEGAFEFQIDQVKLIK